MAQQLAEKQKRTVPERKTRKREALAHLEALRRVLLTRIGTPARDPISEARLAREHQRDEVLLPARER